MKILGIFKEDNGIISKLRGMFPEVFSASFSSEEGSADFIPSLAINDPLIGTDFISNIPGIMDFDAIIFSDETVVKETASYFAGKNALGLIAHSKEIKFEDGKIIGLVYGWENFVAEVFSQKKPALLILKDDKKCFPYNRLKKGNNYKETKSKISPLKKSADKPAEEDRRLQRSYKGVNLLKKSADSKGICEVIQVTKTHSLDCISSECLENNPLIESKVVVGVGRGVKESLIPKIKEFASSIGAEICCTRPVGDRGLIDANRIVGDTGLSINPELYIAFGISGAIQHIDAVHAKHIIAFNADPNAPIFSKADLSINQKIENVIEDLLSWAKNSSR